MGRGKTRKWTMEEEDFLIREYGKSTREEIAQALDRTVQSVQGKASGLKLKAKTVNEITPDGFLRCNRCDEVKSLDNFYLEKSKNGTYRYRRTCKKCRYEYKVKYYTNLRMMKTMEERQLILEARERTSKEIYRCCHCGIKKLGENFPFFQKTLKRDTRCKRCKVIHSQKEKINRIIEGRDW